MGLAQQQPHVRRITLDEVKSGAGAAKATDLAKLSVDAARYHREAAQADYFPKIDATFGNFHFNKFMGERIELARRTAELPLVAKDQTFAFFTVTQPVTPLFKVHQAVDIARADEAIAKAKAGALVAQASNNVERLYFDLLIAQRQQTVAAKAQVVELTQALNALLGFGPETELELAPPEPVLETISEQDATQQALANSAEVVEAEQTVAKARAARNLSKLEYVPDVAVLGGYTYQTAIPALPKDFTFVGVMATFNIFDFGKREKLIKERQTQLGMAEANVDLVKAKVAASARKAFLDLQRARKIRDLTRQLATVYEVRTVSYDEAALNNKPDRAQAEVDMFQAELDYRLAYSELRQVMEGR